MNMLSTAPLFSDEQWLPTAYRVRAKYPLVQPQGQPEIVSLGIPTYFYGHEPPNMFQTHVAKFFANSVREDALISIALNGIIFFVSLPIIVVILGAQRSLTPTVLNRSLGQREQCKRSSRMPARTSR